jgi:hypothetical protein
MGNHLEELAFEHLWRFETRLPIYCRKPSLSTLRPITSTTHTRRSPSSSPRYKRHPAASGAHLFRTSRRHGFRGPYGIVALYVRCMRQAQGLVPGQRRSPQPLPAVMEASRRPLTPRRATRLVLRPSARSAGPTLPPSGLTRQESSTTPGPHQHSQR